MGLFGFGRRKKEAALSSEELYKQGAELFDQGKLSAAITLLEKAAQLGHSAAQNHLGVDYQRGEGVPKDIQKAIYWYPKAINQENPKAMRNLGLLYKNGKEVPQDYQKALELFLRSAQLGNDGAMNTLAIMYEDGLGVARDLDEAVKWYQKAADKGNTKAIYNLGLFYYNAEGAARDLEKTYAYWRKAADRGHEKAKEYLKEVEEALRQMGKPVAEAPKKESVSYSQKDLLLQAAFIAYNADDFVMALENFKEAGDLSDSFAAYMAAELYLRPELLDYEQAEIWARKAEKGGYFRAKTLLRRIHWESGNHYLIEADEAHTRYRVDHMGEKDYELLIKEASESPEYKRLYALAIEKLRSAAEQDHTWAMVALANSFYWNFYPNEDMAQLEEATRWIERAVELGDSVAERLSPWVCGVYYLKRGLQYVRTDQRKALPYFRTGAEHGDRSCMLNTAVCLYNQYYDRSSMEEALEWATKAEQRGVKEAADLIQSIKGRLRIL